MEISNSARLDTPAWLWASWGQCARAIATAHQTEAPLDVTLKPGVPLPEGGTLLPTGSVRFPAGTRVADIPGFETGDLWVQDAAAALPARLLAPQPGERIADLCAAPGGKTAQLAAAGAIVTAIERDADSHRTPDRQPEAMASARGCDQRRRDHLAARRARSTPCCWTLRAAQPAPSAAIRMSLASSGRADVQTVVQAQDKLLEAAAAMLRPGGRLIYAVCSLQPEEGAPRIAAAAQGSGLRHDPFRPEELAALPEALTPDGFLRTHPGLWPDRGGMDGFFAARLIKT